MIEFLKNEADRCLMCKNPRCKQHCPISTPIPEVIALYREGKMIEAGDMLFKNNPLSLICSIVCPHEDQCKGNCIRGIKGEPVHFYEIEKEISSKFLEKAEIIVENKLDDRVAIIGAGPAGITIAFVLATKGYKVTIFDSHEKIGGVLRYGIPEFRLPRTIIDELEDKLIQVGVKIRPNTLIGPVVTLDKLFEDGYKAAFIGTGVWNPRTLDIKGETLGNSHYAIDYLKSPSVYRLGKKVCIIGAGNVAMDAARTAKQNGAEEVYVLYRKGFEDMPATKVEIQEAREDGVKFELYKAPLETTEEGVKYIETEKIVLEDGRVNSVSIEGSENIFKCDSVIIAISQLPKNNIVNNTRGLATHKSGLLLADNTGHTSRNGVFASGDVVTGAKTVVQAVADAKNVAESIDEYCIELRANK